MKLIRYGILTGIILAALYISAFFSSVKYGNLFLKRLYTDEALSSASLDALAFNEEEYGKSNAKRAVERFYKSIDCFGRLGDGIVLVIFLDEDKMYYCGKEEDLHEKEYSGNGLNADVSSLMQSLYATDLSAKPFIGNEEVLCKKSFIAVFDEAGDLRAGIGGAVRKRKKENKWNNH